MAKRWYVVQTKLGQELFARDNLRDQGFKVFYPFFEKKVKLRGTTHLKELPLYPSYFFVKIDPKRDYWRPICSTRGVYRLLSATEDAISSCVPEEFIEDLIKSADKFGKVKLKDAAEATIRFLPGDLLHIDHGPFKGHLGKCKQVTNKNVVIFLTLLSREIRLCLGLDFVSRAQNA